MLLILSCDGQLVGSLRVGERLTRGERSRCISCSVLVDAAQLSSLSARPPRELGWVTSSTRVLAALRWRRSAGSLAACRPASCRLQANLAQPIGARQRFQRSRERMTFDRWRPCAGVVVEYCCAHDVWLCVGTI